MRMFISQGMSISRSRSNSPKPHLISVATPGPTSRNVPFISHDSAATPGPSHVDTPGRVFFWYEWAVIVLLLMLFLILLFLFRKCAKEQLYKVVRRRRCQVQPTIVTEPVVVHTRTSVSHSHPQQNHELVTFSNLYESEISSSNKINYDLPPPYSELSTEYPSENSAREYFFKKNILKKQVSRPKIYGPHSSSDEENFCYDFQEHRYMEGKQQTNQE